MQINLESKRAEIIDAITRHPVVIICGETGSGKTTQIPQMCLEANRAKNGKIIACTQPRRIAAITVAERVNTELGEHRNLVGWQHRFAKKLHPENKIKFMTDGILLAELRNSPLLNAYDSIMVDEAHERTLNIDFILGCLKRIIAVRKDLKVIISSATLETSKFSEYFDNAPVVTILGRTFPVELRYRDPDNDSDLPYVIADAVDGIRTEFTLGDILVFLPGERDIRTTIEILRGRNLENCKILPLMASLSPAEQKLVFITINGVQRIILSTNVAETSVTIPGIRFVIDSGLARISRYNHRARIKRLHIESISQASAEQRKGRCGRLGPGVCIRLYSEEDYLKRPKFTEPEIRRTSLSGTILSMLDWHLGEISAFPFIQPPAQTMIREGYKELLEISAIRPVENKDNAKSPQLYTLTHIGSKIAHLPLEPRLSRIIIAADEEKVVPDALTIVSYLSCENPLVRPADKLEESTKKHSKFKSDKSDFAGIIKLWRFFNTDSSALSRNAKKKLCQENFVSYRKLCEWEDIREQIEKQLKSIGIQQHTASSGGTEEGLLRAIMSGLLTNLGVWDPNSKDYKGSNGIRFSIFPGSGLYKKPPQWIMASELVETSRLFAKNAASIQQEWIEPIAKHICKYSYYSTFWDEKFGTTRALRRVVLHGLVIAEGDKCDYSKIDPENSRMMLIRHGLIEGELPQPIPAIVKKNLDFIRTRAAMQHRTRTYDYNRDNELYEYFYESKIPKTCINFPALKKWLSSLNKIELDELLLSNATFSEESRDTDGFPDFVTIGDKKFSLVYRHNPGGDDDGITCNVLMKNIPLLRFWHFDWLVPGMLKEKVAKLLTMISRNELSAISSALAVKCSHNNTKDLATELIKSLHPNKLPLSLDLAQEISRLTGICISRKIFEEENVPPHFRIKWRILNEKKTPVFESGNINEIYEFYSELKKLAPDLIKNETFAFGNFKEIAQVTLNDFDEIPSKIIVGNSGWEICAYPAMHEDNENSGNNGNSGKISLKLFSTKTDADTSHKNGLIQFVLQNLSTKKASCPPKSHIKRKVQKPIRLSENSNDIEYGALSDICFSKDETPLRSSAKIAGLIEQCKQNFSEMVTRKQKLLDAISALANDIEISLECSGNIPEESIVDIAEQIGLLMFPGFAKYIPLSNLLSYPRYFQALNMRIEKANVDPHKEVQRLRQVQPSWQKYTSFIVLTDKPVHNKKLLNEYRWHIEELRVSVWAQELKTAYPVSIQRLDKLWEQAMIYSE